MSNEYKDWEVDTIEEEKRLVEKYPFLHLRDEWECKVDTKRPLMFLEIPDGWMSMFLTMCEEVREVLIKVGRLDTFFFVQVKEKYNRLVCYCSDCIDEVDAILDKYEDMASGICCMCGKPAVHTSKGYIASYCEECWKDRGEV